MVSWHVIQNKKQHFRSLLQKPKRVKSPDPSPAPTTNPGDKKKRKKKCTSGCSEAAVRLCIEKVLKNKNN